jgi:hypothetical protein
MASNHRKASLIYFPQLEGCAPAPSGLNSRSAETKGFEPLGVITLRALAMSGSLKMFTIHTSRKMVYRWITTLT